MVEAFWNGAHNLDVSDSQYVAKLTDIQRNDAYKLGQRFGGKTTATAQAKVMRAKMAQMFQNAENNNHQNDGGLEYGTGRTVQGTQTLYRGGKTSVFALGSGAQKETGNRSRVPGAVGEGGRGISEDRSIERQHRELIPESLRFTEKDYYTPDSNSLLAQVQNAFQEDYGIRCYVIKAASWKRKNAACAYNGEVYISESIDAATLTTAIPHEITHVMKQRGFAPYLEFVEKTPDFLNMKSNGTHKAIKHISEHTDINIFEMDDTQQIYFYDELNATVYGMYKSGVLDDISRYEFGEWVPMAFHDFNDYIEQLDRIHAQFKAQQRVGKGQVYYGYSGQTMEDRAATGAKLTKVQQVGVDFATRLAKSRGISIYFYESYVDSNGNRVYKDKNGKVVTAENGFYDPSDRSIHIDLNAGSDGRGTVLFTIAHELVHFIKDTSPRHFKQLANLLMKGYKAKGQSVQELIAAQQAFAKEHGRTLTAEEAYDEVIADSMEGILADGRVMELMQALEAKDKGLAATVKRFFRDIAKLIKATISAYKGYKPDSDEGRMVMHMEAIYRQLQEIFAEGIYEGGENHMAMGTQKNTTDEGGVKNAGRRSAVAEWQRDTYSFKEHDIISAVYGIRAEKALRGHDLVKIGTMPAVYRNLFELSGDVYVSNEHLYQNMVSLKTAIAENRRNDKAGVDYHDLGEDKIVSAIEKFQDPLAIMESAKDYAEPRLVAILDEKGKDEQNLIAVMQLYADRTTPQSSNPRNHVLLTIYEKNSLPDYVGQTIEKDRVLYIKKGIPKETVASLQLAGTESDETLKNNLARFNKKVKAFKQEKKITYSARKGESNRSLLVNALESTLQHEVEKTTLDKYKALIPKIEELEAHLREVNGKLRELYFAKGPRDTVQIEQLREDATKTANRIDILDKQLLRLEATAPLMRVLSEHKNRTNISRVIVCLELLKSSVILIYRR